MTNHSDAGLKQWHSQPFNGPLKYTHIKNMQQSNYNDKITAFQADLLPQMSHFGIANPVSCEQTPDD